MFDQQTVEMLLTGVWDTIYMTVVATFFSYVFGMVMGVVLVICRKDGIRPNALVYSVLDVVVNLMPVSLLEFYQHLGTFNLITVFGKVYRTVDLCIPLYILLTILLIPIMYREYKTKQVL